MVSKEENTIQSINVIECDATQREDKAVMSCLLNSNDLNTLKKITTQNYIGYNNPNVPFDFYPICQNNLPSLLELFASLYEFNNALLYKTDSFSNQNLLLLFEQLDKVDSFKHPYIVILTKSIETKEDLILLTTKYRYNRRTLKVININPEHDENQFNKMVSQQLLKIFGYYNQLGDRLFHTEDDKETKRRYLAHKINFLVCGKSGAGKSTFINEFMEEQKSLEGERNSCTTKIIEYFHNKYLLSIYDTKGFENNQHVNNVIQIIDNMLKNKNSQTQEIHMILYFVDSKGRFENVDIYFLKQLKELNQRYNIQFPIIFILSKCKDIKTANNKANTLVECLQEINLIDKIIVCPLELGGFENKEKCFGMKELVNTINDYFQMQKINKESLGVKLNQKITENLLTEIKQQSFLINPLCNIETYKRNCRKKSSEIVFSFVLFNFMLGFLMNKKQKCTVIRSCLEEIACIIYNYPIKEDELDLFMQHNNELTKIELTTIHKEASIITVEDECDCTCFVHTITRKFTSFIEEKLTLDNIKPFLLNAIDEINEAINDLSKFNADKITSLKEQLPLK